MRGRTCAIVLYGGQIYGWTILLECVIEAQLPFIHKRCFYAIDQVRIAKHCEGNGIEAGTAVLSCHTLQALEPDTAKREEVGA